MTVLQGMSGDARKAAGAPVGSKKVKRTSTYLLDRHVILDYKTFHRLVCGLRCKHNVRMDDD